jgi:hypothetical protein
VPAVQRRLVAILDGTPRVACRLDWRSQHR